MSDWVSMEKQKDSYTTSLFGDGKCTFPSSAFIRIFYQKIGRSSDPQLTIIKADYEWTNQK